MDARLRLAIGGVATVAASVAVVCAVALTNASALVDSAGVSSGSRAVVVPSPSGTPSITATPSAAAVVPAPAPTAETVPAPEPEDIAVAAPATAPAPASPPQASVPELPSRAVEKQLLTDAVATGSWDGVRAWASSHGWSDTEVSAWIARLEAKAGELREQGIQP